MRTHKFTMTKLREVATSRAPGYLDDVLRSAVEATEERVVLGRDDYLRIRRQYRMAASGPGTELKKLLGKIGIRATPTCACNRRANQMDAAEAREPGWCQQNLDTIVGWLREEAEKRRLPFLDAAGRLLVRRAIRNAKRAAEG